MSRTTVAQLHRLARSVSELLPDGLSVEVDSHSGRKHVNLYRAAQAVAVPATQIRTMRAGTAGEMYEWLLAMREALVLSKDGS